MIITVSRENGSGGKWVAENLAEKLGLPVYDAELVHYAAQSGLGNLKALKRADEMSTNGYLEKGSLTKGLFKKMTLDDELFSQEKQLIEQLAQGPDAIVVGRCANFILKNTPTLDVFLYAEDEAFKAARKEEFSRLSPKEAVKMIRERDKRRAMYVQYHTGETWGKKENYDLLIDTGKVGVENAAELIAAAYKMKKAMEAKENTNAEK